MANRFERRRLRVKWHTEPNIEIESLSQENSLIPWLKKQAETHNLTTLLAHADDGVIWGRFDGIWHFSNSHSANVSPPLRPDTLQGCRLFGETAEVYLWRNEADAWQARLIRDGEVEVVTDPDSLDFDAIDDPQILWGTEKDQEENGFTLVADGQRNQHAPPVGSQNLHFGKDGEVRPLRLWVRHYLQVDRADGSLTSLTDETKQIASGAAYIGLSRLVALEYLEPEVK